MTITTCDSMQAKNPSVKEKEVIGEEKKMRKKTKV